jgi:hypothetical protein
MKFSYCIEQRITLVSVGQSKIMVCCTQMKILNGQITLMQYIEGVDHSKSLIKILNSSHPLNVLLIFLFRSICVLAQ